MAKIEASLLRAAREGNEPAIFRLVCMTREGAENSRVILPVVLQLLKENHPPERFDLSGPVPALTIARHCFFAIIQGCRSIRDPQFIVSHLKTYWPFIHKWTTCCIRTCTAREQGYLMNRQTSRLKCSVHMETAEFIDALGDHRAVQVMMTATPGFVIEVAELWLHAVRGHDHDVVGYNSRALFSIYPENGRLVGELAAFFEENTDKVVAGCLRHLTLMSQESIIQTGDMTATIQLMCGNGDTGPTSAKFRQELLAKDSTSLITHVFARFTSSKRKFAPEALTISALHLQFCFAQCFTCIDSALKGHLLPSILKAVALQYRDEAFAHNNADGVLEAFNATLISLLNSIAEYIVYHSIHRRVSRFLEKAHRLGLDEHLRPGPLRDAWESMCSANVRMLEQRRWFDPKWELHCGGPQCSNMAEGSARYRCGGCAYESYCSRDCQKQDWRNGHKEVCTEFVSRRQDGETQRMPMQDYHSVDWLMKYHLAENMHLIKTKQHTKLPNGDEPVIVLVVNYLANPPMIRVLSSQEFIGSYLPGMDSDGGWFRLWEEVKGQVDESDVKEMIVHAAFPEGAHPRVIFRCTLAL